MVAEDDRCQQFMKNEKKLSSLMPIIKSHTSINEIGPDLLFFQHLGAAVRKAKFPHTQIKKKENQIRELIHRSIESEEVVDVFQMHYHLEKEEQKEAQKLFRKAKEMDPDTLGIDDLIDKESASC